MKKIGLILTTFLLLSAVSFCQKPKQKPVTEPPPKPKVDTPKQMQFAVDTQKIIMMVSDTTLFTVKDSVSKKELGKRYDNGVFWIFGYVVREKHNTGEGVADAASQKCVDQSGNPISCYNDYWKPIAFLNIRKEPLPKSVVIWNIASADSVPK